MDAKDLAAPSPTSPGRPDWATVIAIAAIAQCITVGGHEGVHAVTCVAVGGDLQEYAALHVLCDAGGIVQGKIESASASLANLAVGTVAWLVARRAVDRRDGLALGVWLFMLMNWTMGAGYWMFSSAAGVGDWANVIEGWSPPLAWRLGMFLLGTVTFVGLVAASLHLLGRLMGGEEPARRFRVIGAVAYATAAAVTALAGLFHPAGLGSLPVVAGLSASLGAYSPLLWMGGWFRSTRFEKPGGPPLVVARNGWILALALAVVFLYAVVLGRTLTFRAPGG